MIISTNQSSWIVWYEPLSMRPMLVLPFVRLRSSAMEAIGMVIQRMDAVITAPQGAYLASANLAYAQLDRANLQDISTGRAECFFEYTWRGIRPGRKGRPTSFNGASLKGAN